MGLFQETPADDILEAMNKSVSRACLTALVFLLLTIPLQQVSFAARYRLDRTWQTYRSTSVNIYYPRGYESFAIYIADRAEVHLDTLETWYGVRPGLVHIVLNPDLDLGSAFATVLPLRVELPLMPSMDKGIRPQRGLYLDRVLAHELTHVVMMSTVSGVSKPLRTLFGPSVAPLGLAPDWIGEGFSINTESVAGGGRLNSSYHLMLWRTQVLEGEAWALSQLAFPGSVNPHSNRAYIAGAYMIDHLRGRQGGRVRMAEWMRSQAAWPGMHSYAYRNIYGGQSPRELYADVIRATTENLDEIVSRRESDGIVSGRLIQTGRRTGWRYPQWRDSETVIAREIGYDRPQALVILYPSEPGRRDIGPKLSYSGHDGFTLFGEGVIIAEARRGGWAPEELRSTLVYRSFSGEVRTLGKPALEGWAPAWSAETGRLAYVAQRAEGGLELRVVDLDSSAEPAGNMEIVVRTVLGNISDPAWSCDGSRLAFTADLGEGERVFVRDSAQNRMVKVNIEDAAATWDPAFSPGGGLWVSADQGGIFDLFEVDLENGLAWRRTRLLTGAFEPAISRGGDSVVYSQYTPEGFAPALLTGNDWLGDSAGVRIREVNEALFSDPGLSAVRLDEQSMRPYRTYRHAGPRLWLPAVGGLDEMAIGAAVYGRDPLGLMEWRATWLYGLETGLPDVSLQTVYRGLPLDITLDFESYPVERFLVREAILEGDRLILRNEWRHPRRFEGGVTLSQRIARDRGHWNCRITPFGGWVSRERFVQTFKLDSGQPGRHIGSLESRRFHGGLIGLDLLRWNSARRDPVPRYYQRITLFGERELPQAGELEADVFTAMLKLHNPAPLKGTVIATSAALQVQSGDFDYTRTSVRPRGYTDSELSGALVKGGRIAGAGLEFHFPLAFPDHGLGLGWLFLERIRGSLYAEGATGWGGGRSLRRWLEDEGIASFGAEVGFGGYALYEASMSFRAGFAYRTAMGDVACYFRLGLPLFLPSGRDHMI